LTTLSGHDRLVLVGDGESAEIAHDYFTHDSSWRVVAFAVEAAHRRRESLFDLPVVDFEDLAVRYPPSEFAVHVALSSTHLNRPRRRLFRLTKALGYRLPSYVSPQAYLGRHVEIGENVFVFEHNVLQYHARVGDNVVLWSGNHLGHRAVIGSHCFVTSHCVVSGFTEIGEASYLGVNCALANNITIAPDSVIGMGAVVTKSLVEPGRVWVGNPARALEKSSYETMGVPEHERS